MVNADGTIDQVNAEGTSFENGTMGVEDGKVSIKAVDDPVELTIEKKDESGQNALSGAVFGVTPVGGSAFADGTTGDKTLDATDGDGKTLLSGQLVVGGKYEISELCCACGLYACCAEAHGSGDIRWPVKGSGQRSCGV